MYSILQVLPCKRRMQDKQTKFKTEPKWFVLVRRTGMVWSVLDRIPGKRAVWSVLGWNWTEQALRFAHSNSVEDTLQKEMSVREITAVVSRDRLRRKVQTLWQTARQAPTR